MRILQIASIVLLSAVYFTSQAQTLDYKYQAIFVYNIAKYTQWFPENATGDFRIGIVGNASIAETFEKNLQDKKIGTQSIKVINFSSLSDINYCNVLFVPASIKTGVEQVVANWGEKNTMICTERDGWGQKGSTINFILVDGKIRFEINGTSVKKAGLKLSNSLSSMGIAI